MRGQASFLGHGNERSLSSIMPLLPPSPAVYPTRDALLTAAKSWAAGEGYAITISSSYEGKIYLKCDRGGNYQNRHGLTDTIRQRDTRSRLTGAL